MLSPTKKSLKSKIQKTPKHQILISQSTIEDCFTKEVLQMGEIAISHTHTRKNIYKDVSDSILDFTETLKKKKMLVKEALSIRKWNPKSMISCWAIK